jgi:hypothetical protein
MKVTVSAGHGEYQIDPPEGLTITEVWPPDGEEDLWEMAEDLILLKYRRAVPDGPSDVDPYWERVMVWEGDLRAFDAGLFRLVNALDSGLGGDDDTFDYWPSGVRYAKEIAELVTDEWAARVEETARKVVAEQREEFAEELLTKCGYVVELPMPNQEMTNAQIAGSLVSMAHLGVGRGVTDRQYLLLLEAARRLAP